MKKANHHLCPRLLADLFMVIVCLFPIASKTGLHHHNFPVQFNIVISVLLSFVKFPADQKIVLLHFVARFFTYYADIQVHDTDPPQVLSQTIVAGGQTKCCN